MANVLFNNMAAFECKSHLRHKLLDEFPGHGHVEGPDLLSSGYDLCGRKKEAVGPSVPELHGVAVGDAKLSQSPVQWATACNVKKAGDTTNLS